MIAVVAAGAASDIISLVHCAPRRADVWRALLIGRPSERDREDVGTSDRCATNASGATRRNAMRRRRRPLDRLV